MSKALQTPKEILSFHKAISFCIESHLEKANSSRDAVRFLDGVTPYPVHPIWCAMTLLTEMELSAEFRYSGYLALLWHDVLEDTKAELPDYASEYIKLLVQDMTFSGLSEERNEIWTKSKEVQLLKLYDKVSNLMDGGWMSNEKWDSYVSYTQDLTASVASHFGNNLNIVKISLQIAVDRGI